MSGKRDYALFQCLMRRFSLLSLGSLAPFVDRLMVAHEQSVKRDLIPEQIITPCKLYHIDIRQKQDNKPLGINKPHIEIMKERFMSSLSLQTRDISLGKELPRDYTYKDRRNEIVLNVPPWIILELDLLLALH